ncbi:type II toxin-antitoxin system RelE/ParE family toxin [Photorhabdus heterorhabditis]|uniref:type II toxin-antitoxin system RelE/ParE family toxin n=1 Tax=Photorhabdus heterorhabditis TaxID=880156 RepID=UPI0021CF5AFE|nr:type II toxin-antitoxin system RelE/ParE family toxin [Photorhabdus heterorhabditis]
MSGLQRKPESIFVQSNSILCADGANVAEAYSTSLRVTLTKILDRHPSPGRDRSEDLYFGVLRFPVESHIIYYREVPTGIEVLAVLHQT